MSRNLSYVISLKDEASEAQAHMSEGLEKMHGGFMKIPASAAAAAAGMAAVVAVGAELTHMAFELGTEFDDAWDKIRIGTGKTGEEFEHLKDDVRGILEDIPTDINKAATAITTLNQRMGTGGPERKQLAEDILELSRLTGTDLTENLKNSAQMFRSWNVDAEDQSAVLDKLLRGYQNTGTSVTTLGSTVTELGPIFRTLGIGLSESIALTGALEREGVQTEVVMRGFNTAIGKLASAGIDASTALPDLIATIRDLDDPVDATSLAIELFGSRAGPKLAEAIRAGRLELGELLDEVENGPETIAGLAKATDDAAQVMEKAWNKAKEAAAPVATAVFDLATSILERLVPAINTAAPKLKAFMEDAAKAIRGQLNAGDIIGGVAGVASPLGLANAILGTPKPGDILAGIGGTIDQAGRSGAGTSEAENRRIADENWRTWAAAQEAAAAAAIADVSATVEEKATAESVLAGGTNRGADYWRNLLGLNKTSASEAKADAEKIVETAIDGFVSAMAANRSNLQDQFGDVGAAAASALAVALIENTKSSGAAVFREVETIILKLQKEGVPNWRELGDEYAAAFHDSLIAGTTDAANAALESAAAVLKAHRALTPENFATSLSEAVNLQSLGSGAGIMEGLTKAIDEGGEQNRQALARASASWITEIQRGLPPERATQIVDDFTAALIRTISDDSPEARSALEDIFRNARIEIPRAAIDKAFDDAIAAIEENRGRSKAAAMDAFNIADISQFRRDELSTDQKARMAALMGSFPSDAAQNAERLAKQIADVTLKGNEAIGEAKFRGDTLATLRAMKAAEDQIKKLKEQATEQTQIQDQRKVQEQAIAALRDQFAVENDTLTRQLRDEAYARQLFEIENRATVETTKAKEKFDTDISHLNQTLGLVQTINDTASSMFSQPLDDMIAIVANAQTLAAALNLTVPGGLTSATPGAGTSFDAEGNLRSLNIGNLNVTNNGYMGEGGPAALASEMVDAEMAVLDGAP